MPSEQPREGTRGEKYEDPYPAANPSLQERGSAGGASEQIEPSPNYAGSARSRAGGPTPPGGEGDDLAARLDGDRLQEWFTEIQASASLLPEDLQIIASMIARASTHPEQSARVDHRGCSPSSTRTPPTNAGRRGLAGSTDTNAPRGSCSNEPMPLARASSAQSPSEGEACSDEQTLTKERNY